jgi:hypothetical protein
VRWSRQRRLVAEGMTKLWSFLEKENKRKYSLIVHLQIKEA